MTTLVEAFYALANVLHQNAGAAEPIEIRCDTLWWALKREFDQKWLIRSQFPRKTEPSDILVNTAFSPVIVKLPKQLEPKPIQSAMAIRQLEKDKEPLSAAAKVHMIHQLLNPPIYDGEGNIVGYEKPLITQEQAMALFEGNFEKAIRPSGSEDGP